MFEMTSPTSHNQPPSSEDINPSGVQNGRDEKGRWLPGVAPDGAQPWQPGQSGNPAGRKAYGAYASEWMNTMAAWTETRLRQVIDNRGEEPAAKVAAAQRVLTATGDDKASGDDFDRCCDRTTGKPRAQVDVTSNGETIKSYPIGPMDKV